METKRKTKEEMDEVIECLQAGGVAAFPTDTVYGLGVIYDDEKALERLKEAKGRPENKPIPLMISNLKQIESVAVVTEKAKKLIQKFMPGAFTIILKKRENVPAYRRLANGHTNHRCRRPISLCRYLNAFSIRSFAEITWTPVASRMVLSFESIIHETSC